MRRSWINPIAPRIEPDCDDAKNQTDPTQKEEPVKVRVSDYLLMLLTGYGIILIPVVAFLTGISLLAAWLFGAFR